MKKLLSIVGLAACLTLSACGSGESEHSHGGHSHSGSGEVPAGMVAADSPRYPVGSQAIIAADHMPGMNGAIATITGAFETTLYAVSYDPTNGTSRVTGHEWVVHEELKDPGSAPLEVGAKATLEAEHMEGMKGAVATVDAAEHTTAYLVDYVPTTGGEAVVNHMWVAESELAGDAASGEE